MKHLFFQAILILLPFMSLSLPALPASSNKEVVKETSASIRFADYLSNVATVLEQVHSSPAKNKGLSFTRLHANRTLVLMKRIEDLFAQGAFTMSPLIKTRFYAIFKDIDLLKWPSPAEVRGWSKAIQSYKEFLLAAYIPALSSSNTRELDYEAVAALMAVHQELQNFVFTEDFFEYGWTDLLVDTFIAQPAEFVKEHPYITLGAMVAIVGGCVAYYYYSKKNSLEEWMQQHDVSLILGSQSAADCGVKALYSAWCREQAGENAEEYRTLFLDKARYNRFKTFTGQLLQAQEAAAPVAVAAGATRRGRRRPKVTSPRPAALAKKKPVSTNWLENDQIRRLLGQFNQAAQEGREFGFTTNDFSPYFIDAADGIAPDLVDGFYFRDRELVGPSGDNLVYPADAVPAERVAHCEQVPAGLRGNDNIRARIQEFRAEEGNVIDFIINLNGYSAEDLTALARGEEYEPANRGHYFHVRAINDPQAEAEARLEVTETFRPDQEEIAEVLTNIRNLLRPFEN